MMKSCGNLVTNSQYIQYFKWLLGNPIKPHTQKDWAGYNPKYIILAKKCLRRAEQNPHIIGFKRPLLEAVNCNPDFDTNTQINDGQKYFADKLGLTTLHKEVMDSGASILTRTNEDKLSVHEYLHYLQQQKVVSYSGIVARSKQINYATEKKASMYIKALKRVASKTSSSKLANICVQIIKGLYPTYKMDTLFEIGDNGYQGLDITGNFLNPCRIVVKDNKFYYKHENNNKTQITLKPVMYVGYLLYSLDNLPYMNLNFVEPYPCFKADLTTLNACNECHYYDRNQADKYDEYYITDPRLIYDYYHFVAKAANGPKALITSDKKGTDTHRDLNDEDQKPINKTYLYKVAHNMNN